MNSDKKVAVYDNQIKAREYMGFIAESAGCFCCAGRDGKIYFKAFGESSEIIPLKLFKTYEFGEDYKISRVAFEDGIRSFKFGNETRNTLYINQDNIFIVDEEQIQKIYNHAKDFTINSFEGSVIINPALDYGDLIIVDGKSIIYQGELSFNGRFIADIKSKISIKQKQETTVKKESQKVINRRVQSEINQIDGRITQVVEETAENSEKLTKHEQDINSITDTVQAVETNLNENYSTTKEVNSVINQQADKISNEVSKKLDFIGIVEDFKQIYLEKAIDLNVLRLQIKAKTQYPLNDYQPITIVLDKQKKGNITNEAKEYKLDPGMPLYNLGNICDEIIIEKNSSDTACTVKLIKRLRLVQNEIVEMNNPITEYFEDIKFQLFEGDNYIYLKEYDDWTLHAEYLKNGEINKYYASKVEMNSKIEQTSEDINLEVSKKVDKEKVISTINQTAEQVKIKANKIALEGTVTSNNGFEIDMNGNMTANNGTFNGGAIKLKDNGEGQDPNFTITSGNGKGRYGSTFINLFRDIGAEYGIGLDITESNQPLIVLNNYGTHTIVGANEITTPLLTQTSLKETKKNISKQENVLNIIKKSEIYNYNLKIEKDTDKKHIGFVIGYGYETPKEVVEKDGKGIDLYSMCSILWKAVQELTEKIEKLEKAGENNE